MESPRSDSGPVNEETAEAETPDTTESAPADEAIASADEAADEAADAAADEATDEAAAVAAPVVPRSERIRNWLRGNKKAVLRAAVAAFVIAGAFAGGTVGAYLMDRATVAVKLNVAKTATEAINTLWSYTPENMDQLPNRAAKYLGGGFEEQYRQYVDAIAATNKQAKVTSSTKVVGAAVESLQGSEATAIVYTNTTSTSPQNNDIPSMKYLSYRLELKRFGRDWRVTKMTQVTSLDLTPKLGM